jgi:hypothetical protein
MKTLAVVSFVAALLVETGLGWAQNEPPLPKPTKQHEWFQQLEGEWRSEVQMFPPGQEKAIESEGTEHVRLIGGFWSVAENSGDFMGQPFTGIQTLGYDEEKEQFVGTWIDSVSGYLWKYKGSLNEDGNVLTLETEGPCPMAPGTIAQFKEVLEVKSNDHKVFTSTMQGPDGKWTVGMIINYYRTK